MQSGCSTKDVHHQDVSSIQSMRWNHYRAVPHTVSQIKLHRCGDKRVMEVVVEVDEQGWVSDGDGGSRDLDWKESDHTISDRWRTSERSESIFEVGEAGAWTAPTDGVATWSGLPYPQEHQGQYWKLMVLKSCGLCLEGVVEITHKRRLDTKAVSCGGGTGRACCHQARGRWGEQLLLVGPSKPLDKGCLEPGVWSVTRWVQY